MYWVLLVALLSPSLSWGQTYSTLTMVRPVATGTAGTGLHANNRVYRAYQGIEYNIHADAVGGKWPYTYSLSNAPSGMTIEAGPCTVIGPSCTAGTITWTNPTATASNIVVTVTDALGTQVTGTWSITVSTTIGSGGFCFADAVSGNDTTGNGSLATPYQTLFKVYSSCGSNSIVYFRAGTYNFTGFTPTGSGDCFNTTTWSHGTHPSVLIGYPGETATINFEGSAGSDTGKCIRMSSPYMWFDNLTLDNVGSIGFKLDDRSSYGAVIRRITGLDLLLGHDGSNSAFFMWVRYDVGFSIYDTVQNSTFSGMSDASCALKIYSNHTAIYETSNYTDSIATEAVIALKNGATNYTVRGNTFQASNVPTAIGGNMDRGAVGDNTGGDVYHNLCLGSGTATGQGCITLVQNEVNPATTTQVYRNTFLGRVLFTNADTGDGPYRFYDNVILNADNVGGSCPQYFYCVSVTDYTVLVDNGDNVKGANDGSIANATTGALVGSYRTTYLGVAGYELAAAAGASSPNGFEMRGGFRWNGGVIWR